MSGPSALGRLLRRLGRLLWGLGALLVLLALAGGVPAVLWLYVGWPLPHALPTLAELARALTQNGIPDTILINTLALGCWAAWAVFAASIVAETAAAIGGRTARRIPMAGPLQILASSLVAAVLLTFAPMAPRTHYAQAGEPLPVALAAVEPAAPTPNGLGPSHPIPAEPPPATHQPATTASPARATGRRYTVKPRDTLWGIAQRELGDPFRWHDLYRRNKDRPQPDGGVLTDPDLIRPGWTLELPASTAPSQPDTAHAPAPTSPQSTPLARTPDARQPGERPPATSTPRTTAPSGTTLPAPRTGAVHTHQASRPPRPVRRWSCRPGPWWGCRLPAPSRSHSPQPVSTSGGVDVWASRDRAWPTPTRWPPRPCGACAAPPAPAAHQTPTAMLQTETSITTRTWTGPKTPMPPSAVPHPPRPCQHPPARLRCGPGSSRSGSTTIRR